MCGERKIDKEIENMMKLEYGCSMHWTNKIGEVQNAMITGNGTATAMVTVLLVSGHQKMYVCRFTWNYL